MRKETNDALTIRMVIALGCLGAACIILLALGCAPRPEPVEPTEWPRVLGRCTCSYDNGVSVTWQTKDRDYCESVLCEWCGPQEGR